jgi:tetratricopeptide (TPR) repeat protein
LEVLGLVGSSVGPYQIVGKLGAGGMGEVFLGHDPRLQRRVALKCLTDSEHQPGDVRSRIMREARAAARLNHPNIAGVYDVLEHDGRMFIVMEYVEGESLAARLAHERLALDQVRAIGRQLASALSTAHAQGVIHRDLKPANIHLTPDGSIKVLDFGVAKLSPAGSGVHGAAQSEHTLAGSPGTPIYMSPEQLFSREIDARSDIYSAGVILYEMATGRRPYLETHAVALALAISSAPPPPAHTLNDAIRIDLSDAIGKTLEREPERRFQSARELETALTPTTDVGSAGVREAVSRSGADARVWKWRWIPVTAAIGALTAIGFAARRPLLTRLGVVHPVSSTPVVLAVLPVDNPGADSQAEFLGAGIAGVVAANFASVPGVSVVSRAATAKFETSRMNRAAIRQELGATHVLDLSLKSVTPTAQLVARLYAPDSERPAWEETIQGDALAVERGVLNGLGRALERRGALPRALSSEDWTRIRKLPTTSNEALTAYCQGRAMFNRAGTTDIDGAIDLFRKAIDADPQFALGWSAFADALWAKFERSKDPLVVAQAMDAVKRALAIDAAQPGVLYALGSMQYRTGHHSDAVAALKRALELNADSDDAHRLLGQALADAGDIDGAVAELKKAVAIRRYWANPFTLGFVSDNAGRYQDAVEAFRAATELAPSNAGAFQMLGLAYYHLGDVRQAIGSYQHALSLDPNPAAYANLGWAYYEAGRYDESVQMYKESLKRDPKSPVNHRNIGDVYQRIGRTADARAAYEQAIALGNAMLAVNPRDVRVIAVVALCEAKLGRAAEAERHAAEATTLAPSSGDTWLQSAEVHAVLGQHDNALKDLESAVARGIAAQRVRTEDELAPLRKLPKFEQLLKGAR